MTEAQAPAAPARAGTGTHALRRGLTALGLALAAQLVPRQPGGWLSRYEARAKIVATVLLIVAISLLHRLPSVGMAAAVAAVIVAAAGLRGRHLVRVCLGVPLFTLALALPACLNVVTPGESVLVVWRTDSPALGPWTLPAELSITGPGLTVAARFFLRALACVALALALTDTTSPGALVVGLRRLGLPRVFGTILTMMQRYLVVVLRKAEELHLARLSRSFGGETVRQGHQWAAAGMGILMLSSLRTAEEIHRAMVARAYDGDIRTLDPPHWRARERWLVAGATALAGLLLVWDRWP